jgi:16S rRNA (adenine1518-N6/adenine1519-N6)-dimethyltransferase
MTSPKALLRAWNLRPKKRLGQHFLVDPSTAEMIARHTRITSRDTVIEIGSGLGALTIPLARMAARVYAVEKDSKLAQLLKTELGVQDLTNVKIIEQNILDVDLRELAQKSDRPLIVTGNLPYNISSQVIVQLIETRCFVKHATLMFQKELARRITAKPGNKDYGRLTVMLAYCADIKSIATVNASLFYPAPKIDSEVVEINFNVGRQYPPHDEGMLFQVIKAAFGNRRKTLKNALSISDLRIEPLMTQQALWAAGIDPGRRGETLDAAEFVALQISLSQALKAP